MKKHIATLLPLCFACLFALLLLAACAGMPAGASLSVQPPQTEQGRSVATATLTHAPTGTSDLSWDPHQRRLTVSLHISGMAPKSTHPTHIHVGTCRVLGAMRYDLPQVVANNAGQATMKTVVHNVAYLPAGMILNIHNGPTLRTALEQQAIACAPIAFTRTGHVFRGHLTFQGTSAPNESASGLARLSLDHAGRLTVQVHVQGLVPRSVHAAHIHAGSCDVQGKVLFPLDPLVADARGLASETKTFEHVSAIPKGGWYVNVHYGAAVTSQGLFNPVACGNVQLIRQH